MLQRFTVLHEHDDPPMQVRSPVADAQRRQWGPGHAASGQSDEIRGIIFGRPQRGGPVVGQEILAEPELPPEPPEQRLVEQHEPGQGDQVPGPVVAPLDVRPLVAEGVEQLLRIRLVRRGPRARGSSAWTR